MYRKLNEEEKAWLEPIKIDVKLIGEVDTVALCELTEALHRIRGSVIIRADLAPEQNTLRCVPVSFNLYSVGNTTREELVSKFKDEARLHVERARNNALKYKLDRISGLDRIEIVFPAIEIDFVENEPN